MRIFLDCEFNGAMGGLLSMGLVSEEGDRVFYEVVDCAEPIEPWVKENVIPVLERTPISYREFQRKLRNYLKQFPVVHIIADHPEDIVRISKALIISGGEWMEDVCPITFEVDPRVSAKASKVPHNAFHDAVAIRDSWLSINGYLQD